MNEITLKIIDKSKLEFLYKLLNEFDFVEIKPQKKQKTADNQRFLSTAGLWQNRDIDALELRKQAWKIQ